MTALRRALRWLAVAACLFALTLLCAATGATRWTP